MDLQQYAIYGDPARAYQTLGANMVNPEKANGETDWGAILANGIRGAAQGAIEAQVRDAYASGQLVSPTYQPTTGPTGLNGLLLVGALVWIMWGNS